MPRLTRRPSIVTAFREFAGHPMGFCLLAAQTVAVLMHAVALASGRTAFSLAPYQNGLYALAVFVFLALLLLRRPSTPVAAGSALWLCFGLLTLMMLGTTIGVLQGNSPVYIASTGLYWSNFLMLALLLPAMGIDRGFHDVARQVLVWLGLASVILGAPLADGPTLALLVILASDLALKRGLWRVLFTASPILLDVADLNRASLATFAMLVVVAGILAHRPLRFLASLALVIGAFAILALADVDTIAAQGTQMHRRISELQDLIRGRTSIETVVALQQRLAEISLVNDLRSGADILTRAFGSGFGTTLDMRGATDVAVTRSALLGAADVHNIHSLPHAILLRYGWLGMAGLVTVTVLLLRNLALCAVRGSREPAILFVLLYPLGRLVEALPASNNFFTDFAFLGVVILGGRMVREGHPASAPRAHGQKLYPKRAISSA